MTQQATEASMQQRARILILALMLAVSFIAVTAQPASADSWVYNGCTFAGANGFASGNDAWAQTTDIDYPATDCDGLTARIQYKVDGYWYWSSTRWCTSNPPSCLKLVQGADDHATSQHRAEAGQNTGDWSATKTHA